ncbi:T9SS type A sorting domain-containing protein [Pinibacter soli]|uniref:T9SS type A sorting domain-containing protein n=1 Tax=Pinibacter soli TaxID=3044211 RepID=A0ABT6RA49_9BACT|nr:T9SS type A sorting domain-containing protein [Pinibacter soli]MDI3319429.1 T9SS type A sorting domain-containing protein [Pinibacter soli]
MSIKASLTTICKGDNVTFVATVAGENYSIIIYHPLQTGDKIRAVLNTNSTCAVVPATISSNTLAFILTQTDSITQGVTLYPNPVSSLLTITELKLNEEWLNLEIVNISGERKIFFQDLIGKKQLLIPVQTLSPGYYVAILKKPQWRICLFEVFEAINK